MNLPNDCRIKERTINLEKAFPLKGLSAKLTGVEIDLHKRKRFSCRRRISAASSASARLLKKVEAAVTPDWSVAEGGVPLIGAVAKRLGLGSLSPRKKEFDQSIKLLFVEMGGLEPPSKHRTRRLSTRLV